MNVLAFDLLRHWRYALQEAICPYGDHTLAGSLP